MWIMCAFTKKLREFLFNGAIALSAIGVVPLVGAAPAEEILPSQSRLGINLSGPVDWNTEHPFVDVFRLSRPWISQAQGQPWGKGPALELDPHGWVKQLTPDGFAEAPILTGGHGPVGDYVCLYDGEGR